MKRILLLLALLLIVSVTAGAWWFQKFLNAPLPISAPVHFQVGQGDRLKGIVERLEARALIRHGWLVRLYARYRGYATELRVGEYALQPGMTLTELFAILRSGRSVQYPLRILEGWTLRDVEAALPDQDTLARAVTDWNPEALARQLQLDWPSAEGALYPDTYLYTRGMSDLQVLKRAAVRMQQVLEQAWKARTENTQIRSPYEALILASIVEKETGRVEEQALIAGVFSDRLKKGMRLQTDPTVIYGLGPEYDGNLTRNHLRSPGPYNTYQITGLPPTPIALPRRQAIEAAIQPDRAGYLFFVARGDGSHIFSKTLAEHNRAVKAFQLKRSEDYRSW